MATNRQKTTKKTPTGRSKRAKVQSLPAGGSLTPKIINDLTKSLKNHGFTYPDTLMMNKAQHDAFIYGMFVDTMLNVGDWCMIGNNILEVIEVTGIAYTVRNIESPNLTHRITKYSNSIKPVPKGDPKMIRTLYGT